MHHLDWSNDESKFVSGSHDYTVRVWDTEQRRPIEVLRGHTDRVFAVQFSPDGTVIASTGEDSQVRFWTTDRVAIREVRSETQVPVPTDSEECHVEWNLATGTIATSGRKDSIIRDDRTLNQTTTFPGALVCWNGDGTLSASAELDRVVIRNAETGVVEAQANLQKAGSEDDIRIQALSWDPVSDRLAVACRIYTAGSSAGAVFIWEIGQENPERVIDFVFSPYCADWSPDGKKLAVGLAYARFIVWDAESGIVTSTGLPAGKEAVYSIRWSPDGTRLATGCGDHSTQIINVDTGQIMALRGHTFPVWDVSWHPHQERLASASGDRTVNIWDTARGELVTTFATDDSARAVAWNSDGKRLAALSAKQTLKIWEVMERAGAVSATGTLPTARLESVSAHNHEKQKVQREPPIIYREEDWTDLLKLIDLKRDQHAGVWTRDGDALISDNQPYSRIHIMAKAPDSYRLRARFTRISGNEAIALTIPVGDAQCRVVLNGWNGPHCGLDKIDGLSPPYGNPTHSRFTCETGDEYLLEIDVACQNKQASVAAFIDGKKLFRWEGETSTLTLDPRESLKHTHCFRLGSYLSEFRYSELKLRTTKSND